MTTEHATEPYYWVKLEYKIHTRAQRSEKTVYIPYGTTTPSASAMEDLAHEYGPDYANWECEETFLTTADLPVETKAREVRNALNSIAHGQFMLKVLGVKTP